MKYDKNTLYAAVEFGFKGHEAGNNLEKVLSDFKRVLEGK